MNKETNIGDWEKEVIKTFLQNAPNIRIQLFTIIVTAYGILYGIVFSGQIASDIVLLIPFIIITLGMQLKFFDYSISITGNYAAENIPGKYTEYALKHSNPFAILLFDVIPKWLLFIYIPMLIGIIYSFMIIYNLTPKITTIVPSYLHWSFWDFIIIFSIIIIATGIYYIVFKQIIKNRILQKLCNKEERKKFLGW